MFGFVIFIHALVCILLVVVVLTQSGRGGGLTEAFSSAESMFGAKTNTILIKATAVLASLFLVTCLSLAVLSAKMNRSLLSGESESQAQGVGIPIEEPKDIPAGVSSSKSEGGLTQGKNSAAMPQPVQDPQPAVVQKTAQETASEAIRAVQKNTQNINTNPQTTEIKQDVPAEPKNSQ